jgi:hypothetical protein
LLVLLGGGFAYALLHSQAKLTGNSIETATANLQISTDGSQYQTARIGFDFAGVIPGGAAVPQSGHSFFLKNTGDTPLGLKLAVSGTPTNSGNIDLSKVTIILTQVSTGTSQSFSLESLISANANGGVSITVPSQIFVGNTQSFTLKASMAADAITGNSAALGNIDFAFNGIATSN